MPEPAKSLRPWFQFSMFRLMVVITLIAILLGLSVAFGGLVELFFVSVAWCIIPTPLVVCLIYGKRDVRTFAVGALIPWAAQLAFQRLSTESAIAATIWLLVMGGICGAMAVATRHWLEQSGNDR